MFFILNEFGGVMVVIVC